MPWNIFVDFNDVDEKHRVFASKRFAQPGVDLSIGTLLWAGDYEGNRCKAVVIDQTERMVTLELDYGSFEASADDGAYAAFA